MRYVQNTEKLQNVIRCLATHEVEVRRYFLSGLQPRITPLDNFDDKLIKVFVLANADRLGTGKANENLVRAAATFREYLKQGILNQLKGMEPNEAHQYLLSRLCDIKGMDQKTANLFLKYAVMFQNELNLVQIDWIPWRPYLHVPLDLWVLRLIGKHYLHVCGDEFESDFQYKGDYTGPGVKTEKYVHLQEDIKEVATSVNLPAITLDSLWFVGSKFCNYHPLLCDVCWLAQFCMKRGIVTWDAVPVTLKSVESEKRKETAKFARGIIRIWKSEHPGKTSDDFFEFVKTPSGKGWLDKQIRR